GWENEYLQGKGILIPVNLFSPRESDLLAAPVNSAKLQVEPKGQKTPIGIWFALAALLAVVAEWWLFHRRTLV
ncbi:MAG: hypothetical protein N2C14_06035, partial [Planctomycetales bacterium]